MSQPNRDHSVMSRSEARRAAVPRDNRGDGLPYSEAISLGEIEYRLRRADDELAELTSTHMGLAEAAAHAEANWKAHRDRIIVRIANSGDKMAADMREAHARMEMDAHTGTSGEDLYRAYKVTEAAAESSARAMRALEVRIGAFQTMAANVRAVTS